MKLRTAVPALLAMALLVGTPGAHALAAPALGVAAPASAVPLQRPDIASPPARRSTALTATPNPAIKGERVRFTTTEPSRKRRAAILQVKHGKRWVTAAKARSRSGRVTFAVSVRAAASYRVRFPAARIKHHRYAKALSSTTTVRIARQVATLAMSGTPTTTQRLQARFLPVRPGRAVALETSTGGAFRVARSGREDAHGTAVFTVALPATGLLHARVRALAGAGAPAVTSGLVTLAPGVPDDHPTGSPSPSPTTSPDPTESPSDTASPSPTDSPTDNPTPIPPDQAAGSDVFSRSSFLYSGPDATQTGVADGTITADRATVVQGTVVDRTSAGYGGATVSIDGHPELGTTHSDSEGSFQLVINGGAPVLVDVTAPGMLAVQRWASGAAGGFITLDPIALTPLSGTVAPVTLGGSAAMAELGTTPSDGCLDGDGHAVACPRANQLFVPSSTHAVAVAADGTETSLSGSVGVRATEYTVGATGPAAMPGTLPSSSGYTYAVELSVDQAPDGSTVRFTDADGHPQTLHNYVTNFLRFPVGVHVPSGYYDQASGQWVGSTDGRVVKILSTDGGAATVDSDGDGTADTGPADDPFTADELSALASSYSVGDELWRVPITHFTPWDYNFSYGCRTICKPAKLRPYHDPNEPDPCESAGSVIGCENQSLGERLPVADSDLQLAYDSTTTAGYGFGRHVHVDLADAIPGIADAGYDVTVTVAGKVYTKQSDEPPAPGDVWDVTWDGTDAFGNPVYGPVTATINASARYHLVYKATREDLDSSWAEWPADATSIGVSRSDGGASFSSKQTVTLNGGQPPSLDLGGWSLASLAHYDAATATETFGDGTTRHVQPIGQLIQAASDTDGDHCDTGDDGAEVCGDGGPLADASVAPGASGTASTMAAAPDGTVYVYDSDERRIRRIAPDGDRTITAFAGNGLSCEDPGLACVVADGGPALQQPLGEVTAIALGPDGNLYGVTDLDASGGDAGFIFRVTPSGAFSIVAGNGIACDPIGNPGCGDGGPARSASVLPQALAVTASGIYFGDFGSFSIRQITPDGRIRSAYGCDIFVDDCPTDLVDGASAAGQTLGLTSSMAAGPDGSLWMTGPANSQVVQIDPAGILHLWGSVDGCDAHATPTCGDGGPASAASFHGPSHVDVDAAGVVHVLDLPGGGGVIRAFTPGGPIHTELGSWVFDTTHLLDSPAGTGATTATLLPHSFLALPDGELLFDDIYADRVLYSINGSAVRATTDDARVPSADGSTYLEFDGAGRETAVHDAATGAVLASFAYDDGLLSSITDAHGGVTHVHRDTDGVPTSITAPSGAVTTLAVGTDGHLATVTIPTGESAAMSYSTDGLLTGFTDLVGGHHTFGYGALGRLTSDTDSLGHTQTLTCVQHGSEGDGPCDGSGTSQTVTITSGTGTTTSYAVKANDDGTVTRSEVLPTGATTAVTASGDGRRLTTVSPAGTEVQDFAPDPRFGMAAAYLASDVLTRPDGSTDTQTSARTAAFTDNRDPYSATSVSTSTTHNGHAAATTTWAWDKTAGRGTVTTTSAAGRVTTTHLDGLERPLDITVDTGTPTSYTYDSHGYAKTATVGSSVTRWAYDSTGHLMSTTAPAGGVTSYTYDTDGRISGVTDATGKSWTTTYDGNGSPLTLTTPRGGSYLVASDAEGQLTGLTLPGAAAASTKGYDAAGAWTSLHLAGGDSLTRTIGGTGLLTATSGAGVSVGYDHVANSGLVSSTQWSATGGGSEQVGLDYNGLTAVGADYAGAVEGSVAADLDADAQVTKLTVHATGSSSVSDAVTRSYDADGLLTGVGPFALTRTGVAGATTTIADATGSTTQTVAGNGDVTDRALAVHGMQVFHEVLTVDAEHRVTGATIGGATTSYGYDATGRLTSAGSTAYTYDADGNLLSTDAGTSTYDAGDRITQAGSTAYTVDDAGRLVARGSDHFTYDAEGELVKAVVGGTTATYTYDGQGRRVAETTPAGTTGYLYGDPTRPERVTTVIEADGHVDVLMYDDRSLLVGFRRDGSTLYYVGADHLGSPRVVADASGTVVATRGYDAWGKPTGSTGLAVPLGFAGGLADPVTGFVHLGLRDYDPATGRFTTMDRVLWAGGRNLYAYAGSDPISVTDPLGTWGAGVSAYAGVGGGASLNIDSTGVSICGEAGFGVGESIEINTDPHASTGVTFGAEATAVAGPLGVTVGASASAGPCTEYSESVTAKGSVGDRNLQVGISNQRSATNPNGDWTASTPTGSRSTPVGEKAEGKVYAKGCVGTSW